MRIGELLRVKLSDIVQSERKILLYLGEKNLHGRVVYYSSVAEQALKKWLAIRQTMSEYLFYGYAGQELSYVAAWMIMQEAVQKAGLGARDIVFIHCGTHSQPTCSMQGCVWRCCNSFWGI